MSQLSDHIEPSCQATTKEVVCSLNGLQKEAFLQVSRSMETLSCNVETSCINIPQSSSSQTGSSLLELVREIQCELGCIEQHGVVLQPVFGDSQWPSVAFDALKEDCPLYQKIFECKMGCKNHQAFRGLTINRCRDSCFAECESDTECNKQSCDKIPCGRKCRKTYCRFGCMLQDTLDGRNKTHHAHPPITSSPSVYEFTVAASTQQRLYTITPSLDQDSSTLQTPRPNVAFLIRVSSPDRRQVSYLWQRNISAPVDLTRFSCQRVLLSYAVVSTHTPLDDLAALPFSPETAVCVDGLGDRPSQVRVDSISATFTEDLRPGYLGYSVVTVSWERPEGFQYVTSYTLTIYPDRDSCGGERLTYKYNNIDKGLTSFTVRAREPIGLLKFGCSYTFEVIAMPTEGHIIGPYITTIARLSGPPPHIQVSCDRIWNETSGHFNISVSWSLQPNNTLTSHITSFAITPMLEQDYAINFSPKEGETEFSVLLTDYEPEAGQEITIQVQSTSDFSYHWRPNPTTGSCTVSADPQPSEIPMDISVSGSTYDPLSNQVSFVLKWTHPLASYGGVAGYDMQLVTEVGGASGDYDGGDNSELKSFPADTSVASVTSRLPTNHSVHCAYVQMRTVNSFSVASEWSEPLVLPLDDQCIIDTSENTGKISLFYETEESGNVKLLELGCHSDSALFGGDTQSGLSETIRDIQQKMEEIHSTEHEERARLAAFEQNLRRVEQKLDALLELVATHVHGNAS